jgi:3-ketosteroid 9alpha-monooxygenase subunit B
VSASLPIFENLIIVDPVTSASIAYPHGTVRDDRFHPLRVKRVVRETADATSYVLDVPFALRPDFAYEAGQFCTFRVRVDGQQHLRCYSMSSSPAVDAELRVTVKRVPAGVVSNWMNDSLAPGDVIDVSPPTGRFVLGDGDTDIVAFSAGSGITPVFSILKTALATTSRHVHLLYANRDRDAVIFGAALDALSERYGDRLTIVHHLDVDHGYVRPETVRPFAEIATDAEFYICGPGPFMDIVEGMLRHHDDVDPGRIHSERFEPLDPPAIPEPEPADTPPVRSRVTIELNGRVDTTDHHPGSTLLQTARQLGMSPPYSCESGNCASCMARLVGGTATMRVDNALTPDEVAEGWVLTCQAVPTSPLVHVVYE